ncbi:MAG: ATP-binding cassette domain-containing protein [Bacteroidota bacterium]
MSEEILKALTQLFAIITKQDGGVTEKERDFVIKYFEQELDQDSVNEYIDLYDKFAEYKKPGEETGEVVEKKKQRKLTSVRDSVKTLAICKKINKTLTQKQKVVVLIKILELVASDKNFTPQRMEIIDTISTVFNISKEEYKLFECFVLKESSAEMPFSDILTVSEKAPDLSGGQKYTHASLQGEIVFMNVKSVDMYFVRYLGSEEVVLNGFIMKSGIIYLFAHGSTIKTPKGDALYYSDLIRNYLSDLEANEISFNVKALEFRFPNGAIGLRNVEISEGPGKLIGIMGASGAGKTTLLNVLAGIESPSSGAVLINGKNIHQEKDSIEGVIGYVSQDDLLIEELTVYQNLYYNAKLCFDGMSEEDLHKRVMTVLESLGLDQRKDLRVGSVLDKTISGGQRKRLNIALELIREPAVLFVDEPTSGLSSRDSENVIDLLKELSLKGKLIFVVIHQPSSDIYKMFDKMFILDTGGFPIFYGHPVEAVTYFKKSTNQVDADRGQCPTCGNVNPEQIFNIIEAKVVDEYGEFTNKRKVNPKQWNARYDKEFKLNWNEDVDVTPPKSLNIPSKFKQTVIFTTRDLLSKLSNKQYMLINFLEAPLLAFILAFIIRYKSSPDQSEYLFRFNENFPVYIMMSIIVALFMGLTVSAEEIIRDRKILKRESFLNLSWNSYLVSKIFILIVISAIQTFCFVLLGNLILEIKDGFFSFWIILFSVSVMANILGLNVSSAFNSAVTVYILIPILIIPQMVLSGLLFSFDKLNDLISTKGKVPVLADVMVSRWAYEAVAVDYYKNNGFQWRFYDFEQQERQSDFQSAFLIPAIKDKLDGIIENKDNDSMKEDLEDDLSLVKVELQKLESTKRIEGINVDELELASITEDQKTAIVAYLDELDSWYKDQFNLAVNKREKLIGLLETSEEIDFDLNELKNTYYNESLADLVRNVTVKNRMIEYEGELIQQIDPVFNEPRARHPLDYRAHFFAPTKNYLGFTLDTFSFNLIVIWLMSILLYVTLYFELLRKGIDSLGSIKFGGNKTAKPKK